MNQELVTVNGKEDTCGARIVEGVMTDHYHGICDEERRGLKFQSMISRKRRKLAGASNRSITTVTRAALDTDV